MQTEGFSITTSPALLPRTLPVMILPGAGWLQKMSVPCRRGEGERGGERGEHLSVYKLQEEGWERFKEEKKNQVSATNHIP